MLASCWRNEAVSCPGAGASAYTRIAQVPLSPEASPAHSDPIPSPGLSPQEAPPASKPAASPAGAPRPLAHVAAAPAAATEESPITGPPCLAQVSGPGGRSPGHVHARTLDARDAPALQAAAEGDWQLPRDRGAAAAAVPGAEGLAPGDSGDDSGKENAGARPAAHGDGRLRGAHSCGTALWKGRQGGSGLWVPGSFDCSGGPEDAGPRGLPQEDVGSPGTDGAGAAPVATPRGGDETWSPGGSSSDGGKENARAASDPDSEPRRVPPVRCGATFLG